MTYPDLTVTALRRKVFPCAPFPAIRRSFLACSAPSIPALFITQRCVATTASRSIVKTMTAVGDWRFSKTVHATLVEQPNDARPQAGRFTVAAATAWSKLRITSASMRRVMNTSRVPVSALGQQSNVTGG